MDLFEMKNSGMNESKKIEELYQKTGNCPMNGYLEDANYQVDDHYLTYTSEKMIGDLTTSSLGIVLKNGICVKQIQRNEQMQYPQMFFWDSSKGEYTYIAFDSEEALQSAFDRVKSFDINLCEGDISEELRYMNISFDNISQVLVHQKVDPISIMMEETQTKKEEINPFQM